MRTTIIEPGMVFRHADGMIWLVLFVDYASNTFFFIDNESVGKYHSSRTGNMMVESWTDGDGNWML
jgi:hypothetical protein